MLDVQMVPVGFVLIGGLMARRYQPTRPGDVASPWLGLNSYGWGGESLHVAQLTVTDELVAKPLTLVVGEAGTYRLYDEDDTQLLS
ncbi:tyrosine-protein kinase, partial [Lysobacter sp. 2RAB21]